METNKEENVKDQPVPYSKRVLFGKRGKPGAISISSATTEKDTNPVNQQMNTETSAINEIHSQQPAKSYTAANATIAGATFKEITKAKYRFWRRFYLRGCYFLAVAVIIKFTLSVYTPDWIIAVYNSIKDLPVLLFVSELNDSLVSAGYLVSFYFLSVIILMVWGIYDGLNIKYLETTASYFLAIKVGSGYSWGAAVFISVFIFIGMSGFVLTQFFYPYIQEYDYSSSSGNLYNIIYFDKYWTLFISYMFVLPSMSACLVEGMLNFISMMLYKLSDEFKANVHSVKGVKYYE